LAFRLGSVTEDEQHVPRALPSESGRFSDQIGPRVPISGKGPVAMAEPPGGMPPPGSPRTVHAPLESHGSRCSAVAMNESAVGTFETCQRTLKRSAYDGKPEVTGTRSERRD